MFPALNFYTWSTFPTLSLKRLLFTGQGHSLKHGAAAADRFVHRWRLALYPYLLRISQESERITPRLGGTKHRNKYVIRRRSLKRKPYSASIWAMEGTNAEALLLDKTLSPSAKNKALLSLKKDELKQCVSKRNLVSTGTKQDLVSFLYFLSILC